MVFFCSGISELFFHTPLLFSSVKKFKVRLKSLLQPGRSEPESYGALVYKWRKIVSRSDFTGQFKTVIMHYKCIE